MVLWDAHVRPLLVTKLCAVPFLRLLTKGLVFRCGQVRHPGLLHLDISGGLLGEGRGSWRRVRSVVILWYWYRSSIHALTSICLRDLLVLSVSLGLLGKILDSVGQFSIKFQDLVIILAKRWGGMCGEKVVQKASIVFLLHALSLRVCFVWEKAMSLVMLLNS